MSHFKSSTASRVTSKPLTGFKVALLAANGFNETDMTAIQRALLGMGAHPRVISPEQGLVNGWAGESWGHHYAVDAHLSTALGADYSFLVIPGGSRSVDKLKLTAHTRRFIGSFLASGKPVAVFGDAAHILALTDNIRDRTVSTAQHLNLVVDQAGGKMSTDAMTIDGPLASGTCETDADRAAFVASVMDFFASHATMQRQQAA